MLERLGYRREHSGPEGDDVWGKVHRNGGFVLCVQELSLLGGELDDQTGPEIGF